MKKIISLLLLLVVTIVIVSGCTAQNTESNENVPNSIAESSYNEITDETTTETATKEIRLSDTCDEILASGYDTEGNLYELVANQTENYSGVKIKIGVIKNNKWAVKPTSDMPFIKNDGSLQNGKGINESKNCFYYIGKGTFLFSYDYKFNIGTVSRTLDIIYNSNTKNHISVMINISL